MSLNLYSQKRNFRNTPEPSGKIKTSASKLSFVVQRHKASHLHYDFRLEIDGVLKSWAVPKGPSLNPHDKRLAMMVEDHPYDYKDFSGVIPEGNYGAGIVEIWDEGYFSDLDNSNKILALKNLKAGLQAGNLKFRLFGKKLKGEFALVKLKNAEGNSWLLIKHKDEYAVEESYNSEEQTVKNSPINKWLSENKKTAKKTSSSKKNSSVIEEKKKEKLKDETSKKKSLKKYLPGETRKLEHYIQPMLAKETDQPFSDKEWIYEIKWDGYRAIAKINKSEVILYSRNGNTFNNSYPSIVTALEKMNLNAVLDGEVIVTDPDGKSNFQLLQHYEASYPLEYRVFDILSLNGKNTCELPLLERKKILQKLIKKNNIVKYSEHIEEKGEAFFSVAKANDLEGIMAKKGDSTYVPGLRTSNWLKIKHHKSQEAIIAGFTEPTGSRNYFGALVLGILKNNKLVYAGHTGSGFNEKLLKEMSRRLKPLIQKNSPFEEIIKTNMPVTWVKPVLVCEIKYTEITTDGKMRHPIFLRLREDKKANEVTMENIKETKTKKIKQSVASKKNSKTEKTKVADEAPDKGNTISFGKIKVNVTNLNKVFWPEKGITKGDVINYYISISKYILPYLKGRPESLKRNPNGIHDKGFFHKDAGDKAPEWVERLPIFSDSANKKIDYIICNNPATLTYLNNLGCIELNPWHSTIEALDNPDYMIIDIDPSENNTFEQVIEVANVFHNILEKAGAPSYCKTSGATGLHIYVPTAKKYTYDQLKNFAHLICIMAQQLLPEFTSLERNLQKRGNKMIYLDHLQNRRGQTISSVYSLRPKEGATVSMPLEWKEVKKGLNPSQFTIHNTLKRIEKKGDIFSAVLGKGIDLKKCLSLLEKQ